MAETFDELTKILGSRLSRRQAFRLFAGGVVSRYLIPGLAGGVVSFLWPKGVAYAAYAATACAPEFCGGGGSDCDQTAAVPCCCPADTHCCSTKGPCCKKNTPPAAADECCGSNCCEPALGEVCCDKARSRCCVPPGFRLEAYHTYPQNKVEIGVREYTGFGLASIGIAQAVNADVNIPSFAPGATYVLVTATRINQAKPAQLILRACSLDCGTQCCQNGDPVVTQLRIAEGRNRVAESFSDLPRAEHFVTVQNGKKGLNRFQVVVNGQRVENVILRSEEVRTIDIASALILSQNIITVIGRGGPGSSALVIISDVPGASGDSKDSAGLPYVVWEEGGGEPGANLHWGM